LVALNLTDEQCGYLKDVLEWWLEDFEQATEDVIKDPSTETPEEMLDAVRVMYHLFEMTQEIKEQLDGNTSPLPTL
jgi:hypothetical protein